MTPLKMLEEIAPALLRLSGEFALAGGLAASVYRERPRLTNDIDIAVVAGTEGETRKAAESFLSENGFRPSLGWVAGSEGVLSSPIAMIIGKRSEDRREPTLDLLLPVLPWVRSAVRRAQDNRIDLGFATFPTLLPEDVILGKTFALSLEPNRFQDLDDIQSILRADNSMDYGLLVAELERLSLTFPRELKGVLPPPLARLRRKGR